MIWYLRRLPLRTKLGVAIVQGICNWLLDEQKARADRRRWRMARLEAFKRITEQLGDDLRTDPDSILGPFLWACAGEIATMRTQIELRTVDERARSYGMSPGPFESYAAFLDRAIAIMDAVPPIGGDMRDDYGLGAHPFRR